MSLDSFDSGVFYKSRRVDIRLTGKENLNSHGARPVYSIISIIKWIWTSRLSPKNYFSLLQVGSV